MPAERKIVVTADGSQSIFIPELNEHYHSHFGAKNESMHVYISAGLNEKLKENLQHVHVFEMGFGTGLNAWLALREAEKQKIRILYSCVEKYPLTEEEYLQLNFEKTNNDECFLKLHACNLGEKIIISDFFSLDKRINDIKILDFSDFQLFDVVFYDAFSPDIQPDLWTEEIFKNIYNHMNPDGILVTYSAKGFVKRNLKAAGFIVENLPGPTGKREITRARKQ